MTGTGAYEQIQAFCRDITGKTDGTYNENMIQAAQEACGISYELTENEAELLLLQNITGNTFSGLADMRGYWAGILSGQFGTGFIVQEDGFEILLEDGSGSLLTE